MQHLIQQEERDASRDALSGRSLRAGETSSLHKRLTLRCRNRPAIGFATRGQWIAAELTADNHKAIYVPAGLAHGFQTLEDDTELLYQMSEVYAPEYARGVRWNDPAFVIEWPEAEPERIIIARDNSYEDWKLS